MRWEYSSLSLLMWLSLFLYGLIMVGLFVLISKNKNKKYAFNLCATALVSIHVLLIILLGFGSSASSSSKVGFEVWVCGRQVEVKSSGVVDKLTSSDEGRFSADKTLVVNGEQGQVQLLPSLESAGLKIDMAKSAFGVPVARDFELKASSDNSLSWLNKSLKYSGSSGEPLLEQYVQCLRVSGKLAERIHVIPDIPLEKLEAAIDSRNFKAGLVKQNALLLIDDSRALTGREGFLVTDSMFDFKPASGEGSSYMSRLGLDGFEAKGASIFRAGEECISFRYVDAGSVEKVCLLLNSYFADRLAWCEQLARDGDREAQFQMSMYAHTEAQGLEWLRKAAEQGHAIAQGNLGAELAGTNLEESYYWLSKAAEQGNEVSLQRLSSAQYDVFR